MIVGEDVIAIKPLYLVLMKNQLGNVKECKTLIKHGHVMVNDEVMRNDKYLVSYDDVIIVDGKSINAQPFVYYMLNKPKGYICASEDQHNPCVVDLIDRDDCVCVGRLDRDTTGFLLLTNDKSLIKDMLLPQNHQPKTYFVTTRLPIENEYIDRFKDGIVIDQNIKCLSATLEIIDCFHCYVTIYEGKYHQVKKMFLSCDNEVVALKRISFGNILLDKSLNEGEYRELTNKEFQKMKELMMK